MNDARLDGLLNTLSGLGDPDQDKGLGWSIVRKRPLTQATLEALYSDGDTLAARLVDLVVDEASKRPVHVYATGDEGGDTEPFADALDELHILERLAETDRWARLYGGAAMVLDVDDGLSPSEPLRIESARELRGVRVVDRYELWRSEYYAAGETTLDRVGEAKNYWLAPHSTGGAELFYLGDVTGMTLLHESRIIPMVGFAVPPARREERDGWGQPVLERYLDKLQAVTGAERAVGHLMHEWRIAILAIKGLRDIVRAPDGSTKLAERMVAFNTAKRIAGLAVIDADGEEFSQQGAPVTGLAELYDRLCQALSGISGIPVTKLWGQSPSGLSTDDESGRTSWYDLVESHQRNRYRRPLRRICEILRATGQADVDADARFRVEFEPLHTPTEKEGAEARKLQAETDDLYFDMGVVSADEIRQSRFGGPGYSSDTRIEEGPAAVPPVNDDGEA